MAKIEASRMPGGGGGVTRSSAGISGAGGRNVNPINKSVKIVPRNTAPKSGLEGRGAKLTPEQQKSRAQDTQWDEAERNMERRFDTAAGGPRAGGKTSGLPGKANLRKTAAIDKAASKTLPVKINSARPWTSTGADPLKANNARALKAANKKK